MAHRRNIHLVGSVPLADPTAVFSALGTHLSDACARYPDGETGQRTNWVMWQVHAFADNPALLEETRDGPLGKRTVFGLREGVPADLLSFAELGYASIAIKSFSIFKGLRQRGVIPAATRFQVSLPTPLAIAYSFGHPGQVHPIADALERRMRLEIAELIAAIPHEDLAIQWDCAIEPIVLAGGMPDLVGGMRDYFLSHASSLIDLIPEDVQVGVHLCYGDPGHTHIIEPTDLALCVDLANALSDVVARPIDWLHMPVPRGRDDDAYFAPLADLTLPKAVELCLGLIHYTDGIEGATRRIAAAIGHRADFAIATECGFGRRDPATVPALLDIHRITAAI